MRRSSCRLVPALLVALACLWTVGPVAAQQRGTIRPAREPIRNRYIVVLDDPFSDAEAVGLEATAVYGGRLRHVFRRALRGFAVETTRGVAAALARDPRVRYVEEDGVIRVQAVQVSPPSWGLDRIDQPQLPLDASYAYPTSGGPVYVHVVDTGIRTTHVEFGGRASIAGDFVDDDGDGDPLDIGNDDAVPGTPDGADCHGHGTHVAGTIGGATYGVAKQVTLSAYRVFDCNGAGTTSTVMAALDAVALDPRRPAVANLSLSGWGSDALDSAVRDVIAAGITVVVAAGNDSLNASLFSPARVAEAITVGAIASNGARATFSNYGPALDLFAPGSSIPSAWYTSDTTVSILSGTSMASPHVAGVAALYLQVMGDHTPAEVQNAIVAGATAGVVTSAGTGSPNRLLYAGVAQSLPSVTVLRPNGGERLFAGTPYRVVWEASDPNGLVGMDVLISTNNGASYTPVPGCTGLAGDARECVWMAPGPVSSQVRIRVVARDAEDEEGSDASNANATIVEGAASLTMKTPNTAVTWAMGSAQAIKWSHNLGSGSVVRLELSRDGGATYPEVIADAVTNSGSTSGSFTWQVTGPLTASARIRVRWLPGDVADPADASFTITAASLVLSSPKASANWGFGTTQRVTWTTNLSATDLVDVHLSLDSGASYPVLLASGVPASAKRADIVVPTLAAASTQARIRVTWSNPGAGASAAGTNPAPFTIATPFLTLTTPNGGESWAPGTLQTLRWSSNLGSLETVFVELSADGGGTYPVVVLASTPSDGKQTVLISSGWTTPNARLRITWTRNVALADTSNGSFTIP